MIFNRTLEDVENAKNIRAKLQSGEDLTDKEIEILSRGTLNVSDISRIEKKTKELKALLDDIGYFTGAITVKEWGYSTDLFKGSDFKRILDNLDVLRSAYYTYFDTPKTPTARYYFQNINDVEKILFDLEKMIEDMKIRVRECGTFECGEENMN